MRTLDKCFAEATARPRAALCQPKPNFASGGSCHRQWSAAPGFFRTGDIGEVDERGYFKIVVARAAPVSTNPPLKYAGVLSSVRTCAETTDVCIVSRNRPWHPMPGLRLPLQSRPPFES